MFIFKFNSIIDIVWIIRSFNFNITIGTYISNIIRIRRGLIVFYSFILLFLFWLIFFNLSLNAPLLFLLELSEFFLVALSMLILSSLLLEESTNLFPYFKVFSSILNISFDCFEISILFWNSFLFSSNASLSFCNKEKRPRNP